MKDCKCLACDKTMLTNYPSERFICGECISLLKVIFEEHPHLKPN